MFKSAAGCDILRSAEEQLKCLKDISATDLLDAQKIAENNLEVEAKWFKYLFMPWTPTVGTGIISEQPIFAIQKGHYHKNITIVAGTNANEGVLFVWKVSRTPVNKMEYVGLVEAVFEDPQDAKAALEYYTPSNGYNITNTSDYRPLLAVMATDVLFRCPTRNISNVIALDATNQALNYLYHFNAVSSFANVAFPRDPECWDKVCHGIELAYVFEPDLRIANASYTNEEWELAQTMGYYWSSIAKNKVPGNGNPDRPVPWTSFGGGSKQNNIVFNVDSVNGGVRMDVNADLDVCEFWDSLNYNWIPN